MNKKKIERESGKIMHKKDREAREELRIFNEIQKMRNKTMTYSEIAKVLTKTLGRNISIHYVQSRIDKRYAPKKLKKLLDAMGMAA